MPSHQEAWQHCGQRHQAHRDDRGADDSGRCGEQRTHDADRNGEAAELGAVPNGALVGRAPNTSNLWLPGHEAEQGLMALDLAGIAASAGSACHAGALEPSPVLLAMGLGEERVASSLRFSFGPDQVVLSGGEIADRVIAALRGT
jgi:cysteine sulfinate desulfinase/cysteine desulfurase-like protein